MFLLPSDHEAVMQANKSKPTKEKPKAKAKSKADGEQKAVKEPNYLVDHMEHYNSRKVPFPPEFDEAFRAKTLCLSERGAQLL
eukprot:934762-Pyramimonas_sp.AAC.1